MRKTAVRSITALLIVALAAGMAFAQGGATKTLQGKVYGSNDAPISGAIVYLENDKTNDIRSFISIADGSYRFGQLAPDTDYKVWARYKDEKSGTKVVSSYDSRTQVFIDLHIKTK
ncbi:MAG TPA: carboxypeptidase-like regulatory domain-containing protein [Acidobacteriaceae bacterium]|nr:carboxypeptidase-like regulatory domain-containing protein [Acidobacteriaceae bacterium]